MKCRFAANVGRDEGLSRKIGDRLEDICGGEAVAAADRYGAVYREIAPKDCETPEDGLLDGRKQIIAPVDRRAEALVAR